MKRALLAFGVLALITTAFAYADIPGDGGGSSLGVRMYSFHSGCGSPIDPVTVVFYGTGYLGLSSHHLGVHTGWGQNYQDPQHFYVEGMCLASDEERADGPASSTRNHIRFRQKPSPTSLGTITLGTAHFEDIVWPECGPQPKHAVRETQNGWSGFDSARRLVRDAMYAGGHGTYYQYYGNTAHMAQCDQQLAWSNGDVAFVEIPNWWH